jgi:glutaredoxin
MLVKALREGLGRVIVFINHVTRPGQIRRAPDVQRDVENAVQGLSLYQFYACPFCVRVRRAIYRLNIPIELRDAQHDQAHRDALRAGGGRIKVPCLRIEENGRSRWLYESADIIEYLNQRFEDFEGTASHAGT